MSFKNFSSAQGAPGKASPDGKAPVAPAANRPAEQPAKAPAQAAPATKP